MTVRATVVITCPHCHFAGMYHEFPERCMSCSASFEAAFIMRALWKVVIGGKAL